MPETPAKPKPAQIPQPAIMAFCGFQVDSIKTWLQLIYAPLGLGLQHKSFMNLKTEEL
jgi:hypothetical protein